MTEERAFAEIKRRSEKWKTYTFYVVREEQNDGTFFDVCTENDLETFYNGISDQNVLVCYEAGERIEY